MLPPELGLHSMLEEFQVSSNKLTGRLPESLCDGGKLRGTVAFDNNLQGELPKSLANCSSLLTVRVERNAFSGSIPAGLCSGVVAVKRIWNDKKLDEKLEKEFQAEVEILSKIRHLNIVKLLCCISSDDSKLLVHEYMERGSLDQWLNANKRSRNDSGSVCQAILDWPTRLRIAVGAAQGLFYMHHGCSPSIIHRDVKSSNILLDSTFNAKVADFGLARLLVNEKETTVSIVAGRPPMREVLKILLHCNRPHDYGSKK